jgi:hypothetical protein
MLTGKRVRSRTAQTRSTSSDNPHVVSSSLGAVSGMTGTASYCGSTKICVRVQLRVKSIVYHSCVYIYALLRLVWR